MTALAQVRNMLFNLRQPGCPCERDGIIRSLEGVEAALVREAAAHRPTDDQVAALRALASVQQPATSAEVGDELARTGLIGNARLIAEGRLDRLVKRGLVRRVRPARWIITEVGTALLAAEGQPA